MTFKGKEVKVVLSVEATEEYDELNSIVGFVLNIIDHKEYDKKFGYK